MVKALLVVIAGVLVLTLLVRLLERRLAFAPAIGEDATPADVGIPFEAATITTRDGEHLHAWLLLRERPAAFVLYFHGNGGNLSVWLPVLAGLHREGYAVAAFDYRGYGRSSGTPSEEGLYRDVDAAIEWVSRRERGGAPIVFWGRSLGTTMAAYAATKARPAGLILESGFPDMRSVIRGSTLLLGLSAFSSYRFPTARLASRAGCPVLVMHGDADGVIPFSNGRALYDALPEPRRFETLRGANHNDAVPPDPQHYWGVVSAFVAALR